MVSRKVLDKYRNSDYPISIKNSSEKHAEVLWSRNGFPKTTILLYAETAVWR